MFFTLTGIYKVCLSDVNMTLGQKTCDQFRSEFGDTHITFVQCDVTSMTSGNIHKPREQLRGEGVSQMTISKSDHKRGRGSKNTQKFDHVVYG